ncbi:acyltransferase [bacterium]|nr:acyltransferase [bacterium]
MYRPEIDGLRSVAVMPVLFFHAGFEVVSGGYVGVDIFFVISGYLITTILINEINAKNFSIINFYERRARRILPALFAMMLISVPLAWLWMVPNQLRDFSQSLVSVSFFSSNILFWLESGYFDVAAELKPLLHTWSLAVEEQYYLLFPIVLLLIWRLGARLALFVLVVIALVSFSLSVKSYGESPSAVFYLAHYRVWELLVGSVAAFIMFGRRIPQNNILSGVGILLIVAPIFWYTDETPFPGLYAIPPVLGTALVIIFAQTGTYVAKVLSRRVFVGIGLISYSAYLWHQPIFSFARIRMLEHPTSAVMLVLVCLSMVFAFISWQFVEKPFRDASRYGRKFIFSSSVIGICVIATIGAMGHFEIIESRFQGVEFADWRDESFCSINKSTELSSVSGELPSRCFTDSDNFILIGDSHAEALSKPLRERILSLGGGLITLTHNGCFPIIGTSRMPSQNECIANKREYWDFALASDATIIIVTRWRLHLVGTRFNNEEGGVEYDARLGSNYVLGSTDDLATHTVKFLTEASKTKKIIVVNQIPEAGWHVPDRVERLRVLRESDAMISTSQAIYSKVNESVVNLFSRLPASENLSVVRVDALVCDTLVPGRCLNTLNGAPLYRDDDHPSPIFADMISRAILRSAMQ